MNRKMIGIALLAVLGLAAIPAASMTASAPAGPGRVLAPADAAFLRDQARRIVDSARLAAGAAAGSRRNTTPYDMHVPGGNMGYPAFWVRDAVMMLGGDIISAAEVEGWIRLMAGALKGPGDWAVRPGVVVPGYAVPDHVSFDGRPTFYPGNYETGDQQGGPPWGKYPPLDDHFYFIGAVHEHMRLTGKADLFKSRIRTSFSQERLADLCERIYRVAPSDPGSGFVTAGDVVTENAKDWGFCDTVLKSGRLLFPSLLKFQAAIRLAELFDAGREPAKAAFYRKDAARIRRAIPETFLSPAAAGRDHIDHVGLSRHVLAVARLWYRVTALRDVGVQCAAVADANAWLPRGRSKGDRQGKPRDPLHLSNEPSAGQPFRVEVGLSFKERG